MHRVLLTIQLDNLDNTHLQQLVHRRDLIKHAQHIFHSLGHRAISQKHESVPFTRRVRFGSEEGLNEFRRVGDEVLEFAVDGVYGKDGVLADVGMAMFETGSADGDEWFE
jgi:hypothetical protein